MTVSIRAAGEGDLDFLAELYADEDVRPFLAAAGSYDRNGIAEKIAGSTACSTRSSPRTWSRRGKR